MAKVFLDPQGFQGQIEAFQSGAESVKSLKYALDKKDVRLQSVDRYMECVEEFNKVVELFGKLMDQDTQSMKLIKAKWMNTDSDIATKTLGQILFGK